MNVMRYLAGLGFGAAAGWMCALIVFDSEWATAPVIVSSIGAILLAVLSTFARNGEDAPPTDVQLDFALRRGVTGTAEVREIERTNLSGGDLPVFRQVLYVEPRQGSPYRTIMSEAIDPVLGSRPVGLESTGGAGCGRPPADPHPRQRLLLRGTLPHPRRDCRR